MNFHSNIHVFFKIPPADDLYGSSCSGVSINLNKIFRSSNFCFCIYLLEMLLDMLTGNIICKNAIMFRCIVIN
jgi:hypothetical protein